MSRVAPRDTLRGTLIVARRELPREAAEGAGSVATRDRTLRQKDWQALHPKRSSLERGPFRAGPPKGQAAAGDGTANLSGKADREG